METINTNTDTRFTTVPGLKVFADTQENIIVYTRTHQTLSGATGARTPQLSLYKVIEKAHKSLTTVLKLFKDSLTNKTYLISSSYDKEMKLWDLTADTPTLLTTLKLPKKIDCSFFALDQSRLFFSDKTGEIHETFITQEEGANDLSLSPAKMVHANMDTLTLLERFELEGRDIMVLGDEYEKFKVFKYPEIYQMTNVYSPYREKNLAKVLNLAPNAFVILFNDGEIDLFDLKSLETNDYTAKRLDAKTKLNGKQISDICKVDSETFLAIDNFFTEIIIYQIKGSEVAKEKVVDIKDLKILREEKEHNKKRFIEAEKEGDSVVLVVKYERSEGENLPAEAKLHGEVYFTEFVVQL